MLMSNKPIAQLPGTQEGQFQQFMAMDPNVRAWRNNFANQFGEQPDMNNPAFDYRRAFLAGNTPQPYAGDNSFHWDSRGKAEDHPTAWMGKFYDQFGGADPVIQSQSPQGLTPPQSQMVNQQLSSDLLTQLLQRIK